ncbi:MaoC family dehydratase N-terminal domain-containing protein [Mycobacterium deserti]|uniref:MaoC family dehydratase N-terminal domain-containing protein n=1 Tax=Mycobacterium deserti TaxID=2978347 RepID=A0ABT2MKJ9_9MYCO|nr:MaoC family dehydratase N-terminal domain-containing protein [Mycobacterium deserti]MCT7662034.1 MaoC family dehydratase N-terminal domain-containing protein [Mycobacterium deserti]
MTADISYEFAYGTYEEARQWIGRKAEPRYAGTAVSGARIQHFASMVRDPNPSYWDEDFARPVWGGLVAPPALLTGLLMPPPWTPCGERPTASIAIRVPLPGVAIINASNDAEFAAPILEGDRLNVVEEVAGVSPEKETRLGAGHFVETLETYYRDDSAPVATIRNTLFRYSPAGQP